jgi:hypothetical protein
MRLPARAASPSSDDSLARRAPATPSISGDRAVPLGGRSYTGFRPPHNL